MSSLISKIHNSVAVNVALKRAPSILSTKDQTAFLALQKFNQDTLRLYDQQKEKVKKQLGQEIPVILVNQDDLSSRYRGIRRDVTYIPPKYHALKSIAHIPIRIHTVRQMQEPQESGKLLGELEGLFRLYQ